jgi:hypothetical protein
MQTFLPYIYPQQSASVLDNKRLGKQRVEAIQIANTLLGFSKGWSHHPAVKMWKGYESYLVQVYLRSMMDEWAKRGFSNLKCERHYQFFMTLPQIYRNLKIKPEWICDEFCMTHRSKLIQKDPVFYKPLFPDAPDNLDYLWPR